MFDINSFGTTQYNEATSTKLDPLKQDTYVAKITKMDAREVQGKKDSTKWYQFLDLELELMFTPQQVQDNGGRESAKVRYSVSLDLTPEGMLDMGKGKNIGLGRLREAVGQNVAGQPWAPNQLMGAMLKAKIGHRPDPKDPTLIYNEVDAVGSLQ